MRTIILSIGNAGGNIAEKMCRRTKHIELKNAQYIFADCDEDDLRKRDANRGKIVNLDSDEALFPSDILKGAKTLIIVVGLGGKTGTKFVELAARTAKDVGIGNVTIVATTPFSFEGENRLNLAVAVVKPLSVIDGVETVIFNNEELLKKYSNLNFFNAFEAVDKEILDVIENLKQ